MKDKIYEEKNSKIRRSETELNTLSIPKVNHIFAVLIKIIIKRTNEKADYVFHLKGVPSSDTFIIKGNTDASLNVSHRFVFELRGKQRVTARI